MSKTDHIRDPRAATGEPAALVCTERMSRTEPGHRQMPVHPRSPTDTYLTILIAHSHSDRPLSLSGKLQHSDF